MQAPATALSPSAISRTKPTSLIGSRCLGSEFFSIQMIQAGHQDNQCEGARSSRPEFLFWLSKLDSCHSPISVSSRRLRDDRGRLRDSRVIKVRAVRPPGVRTLTRAPTRNSGARQRHRWPHRPVHRNGSIFSRPRRCNCPALERRVREAELNAELKTK